MGSSGLSCDHSSRVDHPYRYMPYDDWRHNSALCSWQLNTPLFEVALTLRIFNNLYLLWCRFAVGLYCRDLDWILLARSWELYTGNCGVGDADL